MRINSRHHLFLLNSALLMTFGVGDVAFAADTPAQAGVPFGVPEPPAGAVKSRLRMPLAEIPGDPEVPADAARPEAVELPRQAMRRLEEARRLFAEQRFTETLTELDTVLRYNAEVLEAHRMAALAAMMTGNQQRAQASARQALELHALDAASLYVMGRLAEKDGAADRAMRHYRLALKGPARPDDRSYLLLTHYYLGLLLEGQGYFAAAVEQLQAFEDGVRELKGKEPDNPELATVVRVQRGQALLRLAKAQGYLGDYAGAADTLKTATAAVPHDQALRVEYVKMLARAGRMDAASESAVRLIADNEGDAAAVELLLELHRLAGTPEQAVEALAKIVDEQPDNVPLAMLYADALTAAGRRNQADLFLRDLLKRKPELDDIRWKLIQAQREARRPEAWLRLLAEALHNNPGDFARANAEIDLDSPENLRNLLTTGQKYFPGNEELAPVVDYLRGYMYDRLDDTEQARASFEKALERDAGFLPAAVGLGELYLRRARWQQAADILAKPATERDKPSSKLLTLLGRAHDGLDNYEAAIAAYNKAIETDARDPQPVLLLARLFERIDRHADAQRLYKTAVDLDEGNLVARESLVRSLLTVRRAAELGAALQQVKTMQRTAPNDPATTRAAALLELVTSQNPDRAAYMKVLGGLVKSHPDDIRSREDYAAMLFAGREYAAAREQLEAMLKLDPRNASGHEMLSLVLMKFLELDAAGAQFRQMLELHPNRQVWISNLAEYDLIIGNYDEAVDLWRRLLKLETARPMWLNYRIKLQQTYRMADRLDDARRDAAAWLEELGDEPGRNLMHWFLLAADLDAGDMDGYLGRCEKWLEAKPDDASIRGWYLGTERGLDVQELSRWIIQGQVPFTVISAQKFPRAGGLIGAGKGEEATVQALRWLAKSPQAEAGISMVLDALGGSGQEEQAIEMVNSALAGAESNQRLALLMRRQELFLQARRYDDAIAAAREVVVEARKQFDKQDLAALQIVYQLDMGLGAVFTRAKRYQDAVEHYSKLLADIQQLREGSGGAVAEQVKPIEKDILRMLAFTLQKQGKTDDSVARMQAALKLAPLDVGVNNDLGYTLADAGRDLDEAERMIRLAVGEEPRQAAYLDSLGWVLYKKGDFAGARDWLLRATAHDDGDDPVVWEHLGDARWRLGEKAEAVKCWKHSLARNETLTAEGTSDQGEDFVTRVQGKLDAATGGGEPKVAATSRPATE